MYWKEIMKKDDDTKEIKSIEDLENVENNNLESGGITEVLKDNLSSTNETVIRKNNDIKKKDKKNRRKKIIIISVIIVLLIVAGVVILLLVNKSEKTDNTENKSDYYKTLENNLESGKLSDEFDILLKKLNVNPTSVEVISLDLNSDFSQDLVAYVEDKNHKYLLDFEVDDDISLLDSYELSTKSIGYAYSLLDNDMYWYVINNNQYTVISDSKKIMTKDIFDDNYYVITTKYNKKDILDNAYEYDLDKELDIDLLEKNKITKKRLLNNNSLTTSKVVNLAVSYKAEREKKQAEQQEEELKNKTEEEIKKADESNTLETFQVGDYKLKYGKYVSNIDGTIETYILNGDYTATFIDSNNVEVGCTWSNNSVSLDITCNNKHYSYSPINDGFKDTNNKEYKFMN